MCPPDQYLGTDIAGRTNGMESGSTPSYYAGRYTFYRFIKTKNRTRLPMNPYFSKPLPLP